MTQSSIRILAAALSASLLAGCATMSGAPSIPVSSEPVTIKIIGLNDFHGNIEPIRRPIRVMDDAGETQQIYSAGAAYLATAVEQYRTESEHNLVIAAGDLIGGSPLASSIFLDEPAIGAMNRIGLDFNAVGNHEFDRGWKELKRIQEGGCEKNTLREPCAVENPYPGADFRFLAANVIMPDGDTLFPGGPGATQFEGGDFATIMRSIEDRMFRRFDADTIVLPGHGLDTTLGTEAPSLDEWAARGW